MQFGSEAGMCEKCVEIDDKIKRYSGLLRLITDQLTIERLRELMADLKAQKAALHPELDD
jgi:hypothetical protein